jgi:tetratricopeptide (TPR) repeat protein
MKHGMAKLTWIILSIVFFLFYPHDSFQQEQGDLNDAEVYNTPGMVYRDKGQYDLALSDFTKAIKMNPSYAYAYNNRGMAYCTKQEYDKFWEDVKKAQDLGYPIPPSIS